MKGTALSILVLLAFAALQAEAVKTTCVVQAFGTGLSGKGVHVQVQQSGFGCANVWPWKTVTNSAMFDSSGEAEVQLRLHANSLGVCMTSMIISVKLPYHCTALTRTVSRATWAGVGVPPQGSCRALKQQCGNTVSNAAIPYFDMWCRTPTGQIFATQPQELRMQWSSRSSDDAC